MYATCDSKVSGDFMEDGTFILSRPFSVSIDSITYTVPPAFRTDGASIPFWLWPLIGHPFDLFNFRSAVFHDYVYQYPPEGWGRKDCDLACRAIQKYTGASYNRRRRCYWGLRIGGWPVWLAYRGMKPFNMIIKRGT